MIATHPDSDHITGLVSILKRYNVIHYFASQEQSSIVIYKRLQAALAEEKLTAKYMYAENRIDFPDKTSVYAFWPDGLWFKSGELQALTDLKISLSRHETNNYSIVNLLGYKNFKTLLTGDAITLIEENIAKAIGKRDVLKVSHHGSKTGFSSLFLEDTKSGLVVISVGAKNYMGILQKKS